MSRPLRIEYPGAWYHVMNRGIARANIFETDDHRETFIGLFADLRKRFDIEVHSYCLMDNHYHLLLHTPRGNLSRGMRHLNGLYTQYMNRALGRDGPLMKGRYKSVLVEDDVYLLQVSRYIHLNPVGPGLVKHPVDYKWSSCRHYFDGRIKDPVLITNKVLSLLSSNTQLARRQYLDYVETGVDPDTEKFFGAQRLKPVFGSESFIERIKSQVASDPEISDRRLLDKPVSIDATISQACEHFSVVADELNNGQHNRQRNMVMYVCRQRGFTLAEIAKAIGLNHYSAVNSAIRRMSDEDIETAERLVTTPDK